MSVYCYECRSATVMLVIAGTQLSLLLLILVPFLSLEVIMNNNNKHNKMDFPPFNGVTWGLLCVSCGQWQDDFAF